MKKANINEDSQFLHKLLSKKDYYSKIQIYSGYMNITKQLINTISLSIPNIEIYTSSPQANSFYRAGRFKSYIPYMYRVYERNLLQKKNVKIFEYIKPKWTFHGKGIWLYQRGNEFPSISVVGSSNYSMISFNNKYR